MLERGSGGGGRECERRRNRQACTCLFSSRSHVPPHIPVSSDPGCLILALPLLAPPTGRRSAHAYNVEQHHTFLLFHHAFEPVSSIMDGGIGEDGGHTRA